MVKRCDSVDALRYAYYEMMRIKEENQMLEKNKDYVEFTLQYTSVDWARSKDCPEVCLKGYSDFSFPGVPIMDVVCNEFDHKVVVVSKRDFEALQTENEQLKKKLEEFSPDLPGYREFLTALYPEADVEKLVWVTKHIFGCRSQQDVLQSDLEYYRTLSVVQAKSIYGWKGATGCSTPEEANELLNEKERRITELHDEVKCISDKWASANSSNNSWKAAAECNSPKELIEKLNLLRDDISGRSTVTEHYKRDIEKWQTATGCDTPGAAEKILEYYKSRLGNAVQAASCAAKHLDKITF